ncbi:PREDICTED: hydroxyacylglutathione hydrolase-like protein isoform X2 [Rhagoletis zephyria]|uniref:hydroxyacylglutathione hydrolase-like protein isoform X2 n=1 Tax=Rhagoletis zephyria TaxID=28612 RepID=UPI0008119907|nr:PREDICTED: hydroxyacylglutathione hydrolase-like protein isoform X2 [Rhagoletis zephyria]
MIVWRARRMWADTATPKPAAAAPDLHSKIVDVRCEGMVVKIIPARKNNYMYLITDLPTGCTAAIDLSDNKILFDVLKQEKMKLSYAFITHHHEDHSGGTTELATACPEVKICAGDERIKAVNHCIKRDEKIKLGQMTIHCLHTPCHTVGHYCYFVECGAGGPPALFTGDTLFQGGCGGFDEGTPEQMYAIVKRFCALPKESRVFGGHENTILNLRFAETVEPENSNIHSRLVWAQKQRENKLPTPPSLLCEERLWNPFMRVDHPDVQQYTGDTDPIYTMFCLRKQRDTFK